MLNKIFHHYSKKIVIVLMCMGMASAALYGCDSKDVDASNTADKASDSAKDEYADYIHNAMEAVKNNSDAASDSGTPVAAPTEDNQNGRIIYVEKEDSADVPDSVYVSSSVFPDPADETAGQKDADTPSTESKEKAPANFEVGTGLVYIDGKYDTSYQTELLKYINDARTGLNYPAMTINDSLNTCANLRAKEITTFLSHMRPDGSMFYSLAPDYYKAEIITIDKSPVKETFDAWMTDPISRNILFSKEYTSIGASNYVCNDLNCIVVSFGY